MGKNFKYFSEEFIARWISDGLSNLELKEFESWIKNNPEEKSYFEKIRKIWIETEKIEFHQGNSKETRWLNISDKLQTDKTNVFLIHFYKIASVAAVFILAISIYFWQFYQAGIEVRVPMGKHQVVYLPDSSRVTINAESTIKYKKDNWKTNRKVDLKGEAFFEVKSGQQFDVKSNNVTVTVLGTSFNIYSRGNETEVTCVTGKVSVDNDNHSSKSILTPGYASNVIANNMASKPYQIDVNKKISWISNEYYFSNKSLTEVFNEIGRQYNYHFNLTKNLEAQMFTGLVKGKNIEDALEVICLSANLQYSIKSGSTIMIF
jgi:transmembrane sensor